MACSCIGTLWQEYQPSCIENGRVSRQSRLWCRVFVAREGIVRWIAYIVDFPPGWVGRWWSLWFGWIDVQQWRQVWRRVAGWQTTYVLSCSVPVLLFLIIHHQWLFCGSECMEGNLPFCFVLLCIWGHCFQVQAPGGLYLERRFNGGFFSVTVLRGFYLEGLIFGILR